MFFIVHPATKGKVNAKQIGEIEKFLVRLGFYQNPDIKNDRLKDIKSWSIKHVTIGAGKKGKVSRKYGQFKNMMRIYPRHPI